MHYSLVPSLPARSWIQLDSLLTRLTGVSTDFQVDLVDGQFVDAKSWPFTEDNISNELTKLQTYADVFNLSFDCMVNEPLQYMDRLVSVGAKRIIAHFGSTEDWDGVMQHHQQHGYLLGLAFTNNVPLESVIPLLSGVDSVQVMGIATVGAQGQPFDERTLETVTTLRAAYPELEIAVDGSVNKDTILPLKTAGANRFAPGSAIAVAADPVAAYKQLHDLL